MPVPTVYFRVKTNLARNPFFGCLKLHQSRLGMRHIDKNYVQSVHTKRTKLAHSLTKTGILPIRMGEYIDRIIHS